MPYGTQSFLRSIKPTQDWPSIAMQGQQLVQNYVQACAEHIAEMLAEQFQRGEADFILRRAEPTTHEAAELQKLTSRYRANAGQMRGQNYIRVEKYQVLCRRTRVQQTLWLLASIDVDINAPFSTQLLRQRRISIHVGGVDTVMRHRPDDFYYAYLDQQERDGRLWTSRSIVDLKRNFGNAQVSDNLPYALKREMTQRAPDKFAQPIFARHASGFKPDSPAP